MPTPTQHAASAQTFTDWYTDPSKQASVTDDAQTLATAHAHLAASAGTGTAYTNADALTVEAESLRANGLNYRAAANRALLYAIRATR